MAEITDDRVLPRLLPGHERILIFGPARCGKTTLAAYIARQYNNATQEYYGSMSSESFKHLSLRTRVTFGVPENQQVTHCAVYDNCRDGVEFGMLPYSAPPLKCVEIRIVQTSRKLPDGHSFRARDIRSARKADMVLSFLNNRSIHIVKLKDPRRWPERAENGLVIFDSPTAGDLQEMQRNYRMPQTTDKAQQIVDRIIADLSDRRGLGDSWDDCDDEVKQEIRDTWISIVTCGDGPQ